MLLDDLNPEQSSAVTHTKGPLLIIAGAGTGKTSVIIRKIAYLIEKKLAKPEEILALTFTDKAAEEMEIRVDKLVPYGFVDVMIGTFHSFGDRILRDNAIDLGLTPDYKVMSSAEQAVFFRQHLFQFPIKHFKSLSDPLRHVEALLSVISRAQDEDILPQKYLAWAKKNKDAKQIEIACIYQAYQQLKMEKGFVDFSDQVGLVLKLFREHPAILKKYQQRFKYILVDEFQDTNFSQFELLKLLAARHKNLTVVGDDDQAIYKFRGAAIANILNFEKQYPKCKKIVLSRNYRSTQLILDSAYKVIRHNDPDRLEVKAKINKKLIANSNEAGKLPEHLSFDRASTEADAVAKIIKEKSEKQGMAYSDFAILVRANKDMEMFQQALNIEGIPYRSSNQVNLYNTAEVRLLISFLKVIGDLSDSSSLYHLALSEVYGLNSLDLQKINTFCQRRNYTLHYVFSHINDNGEFAVLNDVTESSRKIIARIMQDINDYLEIAKDKTSGEVLYLFLKKSGLLAKLASSSEYKIKNIGRFFEKVREFKEVAEVDRVCEFVKYFNLMREAGDNPETIVLDDEIEAVNILTVHRAKGLEFKVVFITGLVAEKFPTRDLSAKIDLPDALIREKINKEESHIQEERRLFYVAMTRAKQELYLCSSQFYSSQRQRKISQFILEALDKPKAAIDRETRSVLEQIEMFSPNENEFPQTLSAKSAEILPLSFYHIDDYLTCPLKYKFVHILNVPLLPNHAILYGSALHSAVQAFDLARKSKKKLSFKAMLAVLLGKWSSEGYISREHEEQRLAVAKQALRQFYDKEIKLKPKILSVEDPFSVPKGTILLRGRFDRVDERAGKPVIIDFKSSEVSTQEDADKKARNSLQLAIYALAWKEKHNQLPAATELYFLESGLIGSAIKDEKDIAKAWDKILMVEQGIRAQDFMAKPSSATCSYCAYSGICPCSAV